MRELDVIKAAMAAATQGRCSVDAEPITVYINGHPHQCWPVCSSAGADGKEWDGTGVCVVIMPDEDGGPEVYKERLATARLLCAMLNALPKQVEAAESLLRIKESYADTPCPEITSEQEEVQFAIGCLIEPLAAELEAQHD